MLIRRIAAVLAIVVIAAVAVTVVGLQVLKSIVPRGRPVSLIYKADGSLTFSAQKNDPYARVQWTPDKETGICPFTIHLPSGDVGPKELASKDALKARGWREDRNDGYHSHFTKDEGAVVICSFEKDNLVRVEVSVVPPPTGQSVRITVFGKTFELPAYDDGVIHALGPQGSDLRGNDD